MTDNPSNKRSNRRATGSIPSLGQIGGGDEPLLLPISPTSTIDDITRLIREAGATRIELLVPDATTALQSIAGNEALREAAKAAGIRLTLYTSDEKTTHAARFAKVDVVGIGGASVAAPPPGTQPRRPTGQFRAVQPPVTPRPPQAAAQPPRATERPTRPAPSGAAPTQPAQSAQPMNDAELLQRLDAWQQPPPRADEEPARVQQSDEGALLYDVGGDIGIPRPADDDAEWNTFAQAPGRRSVVDDPAFDLVPQRTPARRRGSPIDDETRQTAAPSLLGALFGFMPQRTARRSKAAPGDVDDAGMRMSRPERSPEETAARRRQSRNLTLWPLLGIALLAVLGIALFVWAQQGAASFQETINRVTGAAPSINIEPPLNTTEAFTRTDLVVPLVTEPVNDPASLNVQGVVVSVPVTVTLQGTAEKTATTPIGFATGTILLSNPTSGAITIPAGTPVRLGDQDFTFDTDVTVPGAQSDFAGTRNGQAEATLTARLPGSQSNVSEGSAIVSDYTAPNGPLRARLAGPFQGGTDQEVPIVTFDDVNRLLPDALSRLYGQGVNEVNNRVQQLAGFTLMKGENTPEILPTQAQLKQIQPEDLQVFPPIGQVVSPELNGKFTLRISRRFEGLASPMDRPIDSQLQQAVANRLRLGDTNVQTDEVQILNWRRGEGGLLVDAMVVPRGGYLRVPAELQQTITQAVRGKPRAEAEQYLADLRSQGQIGDFTLPAQWTTVPEDLELTFNPPSATGTP